MRKSKTTRKTFGILTPAPDLKQKKRQLHFWRQTSHPHPVS